MLKGLLDHIEGAPPPQTVRTVLVGGAALSARLADRARDAHWPICVTYGLSETASQIATLCQLPEDWRAGDVGRPLNGVQLDIVDDDGNPVNAPGRISVTGPAVMAGYAHPQGKRGLGLAGDRLITNDCGFLDTRGHLHVSGRADEVMVSGGENIHPQELEGRLFACPGVEDVAVVGIPHETWGQLIVALIDGTADEASLRLWCKRHLPSAQRPRRFVKVGQLPRNGLGKLDRASLRDYLL
jgi:O-succinylbenzoic acid--CoA ligase